MKIDPYLKRLQLSEKPKKTLSFLEKLQSQHVRQIPFENWDILQQIPLSLHMEDLYEKVIHRRRGGVCFELNGLFHALLVQLGFKAHLMAETVYHGDHWGIEESHTIILVQLDAKQYLVDVGFGGRTPRKPIPLSGEIVQDLDGDYRIIPIQAPILVGSFKRKKSKNGSIYIGSEPISGISTNFHLHRIYSTLSRLNL